MNIRKEALENVRNLIQKDLHATQATIKQNVREINRLANEQRKLKKTRAELTKIIRSIT